MGYRTTRRQVKHATITVDVDKKCAECSRVGACQSGICVNCTAKAMGPGMMKTPAGRAVQARYREMSRRRP